MAEEDEAWAESQEACHMGAVGERRLQRESFRGSPEGL